VGLLVQTTRPAGRLFEDVPKIPSVFYPPRKARFFSSWRLLSATNGKIVVLSDIVRVLRSYIT